MDKEFFLVILSNNTLIKDQVRYLISYLSFKTNYFNDLMHQISLIIVIFTTDVIVNNLKILYFVDKGKYIMIFVLPEILFESNFWF